LPAVSVSEEIDYKGIGMRAGVTLRPNQIHFGGHVDLGELTEGLRFQPNVEIGLGDNRTLLAVDADGLYFFDQSYRWAPYVGGGIGINLIRQPPSGPFDQTSTDIGLNVLAGLERSIGKNRRFFVETKAGIDDSPDFKLTVGLTLKK
jgi:hypothetical protein